MRDRIERSIDIHAPIERVWNLVTEPGWWVSSGRPTGGERTPGAVTVVETREHGTYPVEVVKLEPQTYAAFRWASQFPGEDLVDGHTTLVEFSVEERDAFVRVTVVESGFASLDAPDEVRVAGLTDNTSGWAQELAGLRTRAE